MTAKAIFAPQHRKVGAALGYASEVEDVHMRCTACGKLQVEAFDADSSRNAQMRVVTCDGCGRFGTMAVAPKVAR